MVKNGVFALRVKIPLSQKSAAPQTIREPKVEPEITPADTHA